MSKLFTYNGTEWVEISKNGYTPIKGIDYFDGKTPIKGVDYFDGKDADEQKIISEVVKKIPKPENGKDGSPDTSDQIKEKLESLPKGKRLDYDKLDNTPDLDSFVRRISSKTYDFTELADTPSSYSGQANRTVVVKSDETGLEFGDPITPPIETISNLGAGEGVFAQLSSGDAQFKSLVAGTNVTLSSDADTITINASASGGSDTWIQDDLTDQTDGELTDFALSATPKTGSPFMVYMQGVRQRSTYYTVGGGNISFTFAPPAGTELLVDYIEA